MSRVLGLMCALCILAAGPAFAAKVTNVDLSWQDGFTVARVDVQGAVRFSHQTEEAKDGRPFRVIVDLLAATHHLGQKNFFELPPCPVTKIRSSQFAVDPERVVRLVFDMAGETVYEISSNDKGLVVKFPDKSGKAFAAWSSTGWIASQQKPASAPAMAQAPAPTKPAPTGTPTGAKSAEQLNQSMNNDRLASLGSPAQPATPKADEPAPSRATSTPPSNVTKVATATKPAPATAVPSKPSVPAVARPDTITAELPRKPDIKPVPPQPMMGTSIPDEPTGSEQPAADHTAPPAPSSHPTPLAKPSVMPPSIQPSTPMEVVAKPPAVSPSPSTPPSTPPAAVTKESPTPATAAPSPSPTAAPATSPTEKVSEPEEEPTPEDLEPAEELKEQPDEGKDRSTARFRRSPTSPTKIKGTLVAEFPTRLVIKYQSGNRRDPFETLINESKGYNSPVERRVPNVEGIRLVGVIESDGANSALFEDKDGYGYILHEGDKIQKGYVLRIQPDRVLFQIFEYGWSRTVALNLESEN